ncbi:MAG: hypothetical protein A3G24_17820 [Betaproteobacteria bacterium RIFCSPLOWO2_12_FULL_62_13]|nr:MAG: hypothetical protein A3G24_17820 [Betaproteobacteria bacterium RIFCSPLOWO2_12_FULL_62_13]
MANIGLSDAGSELGQLFGRKADLLFTLAREDEDFRSLLELRIVDDGGALHYIACRDFHEQMIIRTCNGCTTDAERRSTKPTRTCRKCEHGPFFPRYHIHCTR